MRSAGLALLFVLGLGAAGGLSAGVVAATTTGTTTGTTTTATPTIAPGVTVGGVDVGDLTADDAIADVNAAFAEPLVLVAPRSRLAVTPKRLRGVAGGCVVGTRRV